MRQGKHFDVDRQGWSEDPELALHRWLARTLAGRLSDTLRVFDALLD